MIAPPRPPAHDELEALIEEARARQRRRRLLAAAAVAVLAAGALAVHALAAGGSSSPTASSEPGAPIPFCRSSSLFVGLVDMSSPTGLGRIALKFSNNSGNTCRLEGFPAFTFADGHGTIPFTYAHMGTPQQVDLRSGGAAYAVLAKFRCDLGILRSATRGTVTAGGVLQHLPLPEGPAICKPGIPAEGRTVMVYPFRSSIQAAAESSLAQQP